MRINTNISALTANFQLQRSESKLQNSLERLTSGKKLNKASDDTVGMAVSHKMNIQIKGLERASQNASDGVSVVQTAEGGLQEVQSMLQRMRELAVQGANDTYTDQDRENIEIEVQALQEEIDRISTDTEFNNTPLLDGSLKRRSYGDIAGVTSTRISDSVPADAYGITIKADATKATYSGSYASTGIITDATAGKVKINGVTVEAKAGESLDEVYKKISKAGDATGIKVTSSTDTFTAGSSLSFEQDEYGSQSKINIECDDALAGVLGIGSSVTKAGTDIEAEFTTSGSQRIGFNNTATMSSSGDKVTVKDRDGFELTVQFDSNLVANAGGPVDTIDNVLNIGTMTIQLGANEGQTLEISIDEITSKSLGIDKLKFSTSAGCTAAIATIDKAIQQVSSSRSSLGAYQNRLEYATSSIDVTTENVTSALSRIEDVDMAEEMTNYTSYNVLAQAGISMVTQANQMPEKVLQLLQ